MSVDSGISQNVRTALEGVADRFPEPLRTAARQEIARQTHHVDLALLLGKPSGSDRPRVADIGGGLGLFTPGCAAVGMDATLIDDFDDQINHQLGDDALSVHRELGVTIVSRDVIRDGLGLEPNSMDVITTFDSMEHWHDSPKALFAEVMDALKPGGWLILGVPNCVNLRKRLSVPLGKGKWSRMEDWYEQPRFRGHVREPDVDDLHYIARDMGLVDVEVHGRNWLGYLNRRPWVRKVTPLVDKPLRRRPTLCADLYLVGRKPL